MGTQLCRLSRTVSWVAGKRRNQPFTLGEVFAVLVLITPTVWAVIVVWWAEHSTTVVVVRISQVPQQ